MRLVRVVCAVAVFSIASFAAETLTGTLMDQNCKTKDPVKHTRQCAMGCAKSGFGLVTSDGKFLKFDQKGNDKALAALKASKKENDLKATVTGEVHGDMIHVDSVQLQ